MPIMGVHINGRGGGGDSSVSTSLGEELAKSIWGDPELEMKLALQRQEYDREAWVRRKYDAEIAAQNQAAAYDAARTREQEIQSSRMNDVGAIADYQAGLVPAPVPVEISQTHTDLVPPRKVTTTKVNPLDVSPNQIGGSLRIGTAMPAPVDTFDRRFAPLITDVAPVAVTPEQQAAYDREVAARRAQVHASLAGGGNAAQIAQGMGINEGAVKLESPDPAVRAQGETLYTGTRPSAGSSPGEQKAKMEQDLRQEIMTKIPAYKQISTILPLYKSMLNSQERAATGDKSAMLDMLYGTATSLDPDSVVRESDQLIIQNAQGLPASLQSMIAYVNGDGQLTPSQIQELMTLVRGRLDGYTGTFNEQLQQYRGIIERNGLDLRNVLPEFKTPDPVVTEEEIRTVMQASGVSRDDAIKHILLLIREQDAAAGGGR